ncbi:hypothetical protein FHG64_05920 [Antarcticibacterium flavum]|uniref:YtxH domain-containing protein n=1 Tax=Antarcticibacterium flavum TaxID=2058175 RepID=A0A5B7X0V7_9FLAO|nr:MULTISPECIES: hypothetical protein [Antarcticibacterium]MCM4160934.1 hypothetical protein [Antarcticibacterium sp. W02-3]QCY68977.1 hypothetical protein FHG64_05920 [Antarcticibacterium flavum]
MKRAILFTALALLSAGSILSCRDANDRETVVREVEVERTEPVETEERKGILERTGEKVDQKVNKEIDEEIDRIGDDN